MPTPSTTRSFQVPPGATLRLIDVTAPVVVTCAAGDTISVTLTGHAGDGVPISVERAGNAVEVRQRRHSWSALGGNGTSVSFGTRGSAVIVNGTGATRRTVLVSDGRLIVNGVQVATAGHAEPDAADAAPDAAEAAQAVQVAQVAVVVPPETAVLVERCTEVRIIGEVAVRLSGQPRPDARGTA